MIRLPLAAALLLGLAGCGYTPPPQTNTSAPGYTAALDSCEDTAAHQVNVQNAKTGLAWMTSPVRRWGQISDATGACMDRKGYGRLRWCTPAELQAGGRQGDVVVTASGVQCVDPPGRPADTSQPDAAPTAKAAKKSR